MAYASQHATNFARRGIVKDSFVNTLMRDLLPAHPGYYGELLWIFVMLELWLTQHEEQSS
jgi:asparagine synthase (glutamine-hydrolysing)